MNGATIEPTLANIDADPIPTLRITVGKTSPAYMQAVENAAIEKAMPIDDKVGLIQSGSFGTKP